MLKEPIFFLSSVYMMPMAIPFSSNGRIFCPLQNITKNSVFFVFRVHMPLRSPEGSINRKLDGSPQASLQWQQLTKGTLSQSLESQMSPIPSPMSEPDPKHRTMGKKQWLGSWHSKSTKFHYILYMWPICKGGTVAITSAL